MNLFSLAKSGLLIIASCVTGPGAVGQAPASLIPAGSRAAVLYFVASDCPISNRSLPEMKRLEQEFAAKGVRFWFVYPNVTETTAGLAAHQAAYGVRAEDRLTDADGRLGKLTGADTTPEAAVVVPHGAGLRTVYVGRVDDRNLSLGTERPAATRHDLEEAIAAVLAGRTVPKPGGPPVGCYFVTRR